MLIKMSLSLIYYGIINRIILYTLNLAILLKFRRNLSLISPFLLKISAIKSDLNQKCMEIDKKIQEKIFNC